MSMRRDELSSSDPDDFKFIVERAEVGHLGLVDKNGYPRIVPLNFGAVETTIYFHGALEGEKYELLQSSPKASFSVDIPYSFIPSYYQSKNYACPATHFFKSIHIRGTGRIVEDVDEKASALQTLMEKYQPEGNYTKIDANESIYRKAIQEVGVYALDPKEITVKIKFGQNETPEKRNKIIEGLKKRDSEIDRATIEEIRKYGS
jgi:nitroimidazol reductase NimA-like FMN-containing flavoprotein (pyridoxamine 5'-phosphate oxidase superfamily)